MRQLAAVQALRHMLRKVVQKLNNLYWGSEGVRGSCGLLCGGVRDDDAHTVEISHDPEGVLVSDVIPYVEGEEAAL